MTLKETIFQLKEQGWEFKSIKKSVLAHTVWVDFVAMVLDGRPMSTVSIAWCVDTTYMHLDESIVLEYSTVKGFFDMMSAIKGADDIYEIARLAKEENS